MEHDLNGTKVTTEGFKGIQLVNKIDFGKMFGGVNSLTGNKDINLKMIFKNLILNLKYWLKLKISKI